MSCSDEAIFHNSGQLNGHNCHYWSVKTPHWFRTNDHHHRWNLTVCCGVLNGNLIGYFFGTYFFDGNVNSNRYLHFLRRELPNLLEDINLQTRQHMWFQQDSAPAHSRIVFASLIFP